MPPCGDYEGAEVIAPQGNRSESPSPVLTPFPETISLWAMGKTNYERTQALRAKRDKEGLKRFEVWLHPAEWPLVKRYVERLAKRRDGK